MVRIAITFVFALMLSASAWAGNWNKKTTLESNGRIPQKASPNLTDLRESYSRYYEGDLYKNGRLEILASKNPYQFSFNLIKNTQVIRSLENSGLISYLRYEDGQIVIDELSPKNRLGDLISNETTFNSQSVGKSFISYILGHAICDGYIQNLNHQLNDWPLIKGTLYEGQNLNDLINMAAGDSSYFYGAEVKFKNKFNHRNVNHQPIAYWSEALQGSKNINLFGSSWNYNGFLSNLVNNYIAFKAGDNYNGLLIKVFQENAMIEDSAYFLKIDSYTGTARTQNEGRLRSTFFANRYDYLRIAKAMLDDWKNDTCVGKYLKNIYKNKISKEANGHSPYSSSSSYAGFFHTDFIGVKGKVFGMNGYGGQNIFINFDTGTIVVAHAVHQNYNWRTLVLQAVSSK